MRRAVCGAGSVHNVRFLMGGLQLEGLVHLAAVGALDHDGLVVHVLSL